MVEIRVVVMFEEVGMSMWLVGSLTKQGKDVVETSGFPEIGHLQVLG